MYKFSPILTNTYPFRVLNGDLMVLNDEENFVNAFDVDDSSVIDILSDNNIPITIDTLSKYLKSLGLQYVLNQYIINDLHYIIPEIQIASNGVISILLDTVSGFDNITLDEITGQILVNTNNMPGVPNSINIDNTTGIVSGEFLNNQLNNYDTRFIQYYGLSRNNNTEYWYRAGNKSSQIKDITTGGESNATELKYCYTSGGQVPIPSGIEPNEEYQLYYTDDNNSTPELINDKLEDLLYETSTQGTQIIERIQLINQYTNQFIQLLTNINSLDESLPVLDNFIKLTRENYISDYVSFDHNVIKGTPNPILKHSDYLYYEFEELEYCFDSNNGLSIPENIVPDKNYKLAYEQYVDNETYSFNNIISEGDVVEIVFEYKSNAESNILSAQVIDIIVSQYELYTEISPVKFKTSSGFIFEITNDNVVMYSIDPLITDYRIVSAYTINDSSNQE